MTEASRSANSLGAHLADGGCHFGLWAPRAERVELALVNADGTQRNVDMGRDESGVWRTFVSGIEEQQRYGYRVHGEWAPDQGLRANPAKLLVDPYARAITAGVDYSGPILDHTEDSYYEPDTTDSAGAVPLSVVVAPTPAPTPIKQRTPLSESVIYETHVKGYTQLHPLVPEHLRGTYSGLAYPAVIEHLKQIGVTAIELLPVHHFVSEPFIVARGLSNYWGYNTLAYFAPHSAYSSIGTTGEQVTEFKNMVAAFHEAGIEVLLDVVYNHTAEGGHQGPTLAYRGIDHRGYYRLTEDLRDDYDVTGCGNSFDTSHEDVLNLVVESMRYWVTEMGIDGFRFDLATELIRDENHHVDHAHPFKKLVATDPVFDDIKMIAEPWDMGPYGYQVGAWGPGWSEWNDRYRNFMRDFWRGEVHGVQELATRLAGSEDIFGHDRGPSASINFITAHDGFTIRDLVTYDYKHNEANGEDNRDGADDNRSWNCGVEGETDDPQIIALRHRQARNMLATMLLSRGVPMITAGDEMGRTQQGNNNAYCQDSPISWVHWDTLDQWADLRDLMSRLTEIRREYKTLTRDEYLTAEVLTDKRGNELDRREMAWLNGYNGEMTPEDWNDGGRNLLGMYLSNTKRGLIIWFHSGSLPSEVTLPTKNWGKKFKIIEHTAENFEITQTEFAPEEHFAMPPRSIVVMEADFSR